MSKKVKKPYKRNITGFISTFGAAEFTKVDYTNELHQKVSAEEKMLLGVFDVSHFNLSQSKSKAKDIIQKLTGGRLENIIRGITSKFDKKYPYIYCIKPEYQKAFKEYKMLYGKKKKQLYNLKKISSEQIIYCEKLMNNPKTVNLSLN